jgi:hypothetical protein
MLHVWQQPTEPFLLAVGQVVVLESAIGGFLPAGVVDDIGVESAAGPQPLDHLRIDAEVAAPAHLLDQIDELLPFFLSEEVIQAQGEFAVGLAEVELAGVKRDTGAPGRQRDGLCQ